MDLLTIYIIGILVWSFGSLIVQGFKLEELNITTNIVNSIFWIFNLIYYCGVLLKLAVGIYFNNKKETNEQTKS